MACDATVKFQMLTRSATKKMPTVHIFHNIDAMSAHKAPRKFPECAERLTGIHAAISDLIPHCVDHLIDKPAPLSILNNAYGAAEVRRWQAMCGEAGSDIVGDDICSDIYWSLGSLDAVRIAVSGAINAVETVVSAAEVEHAFAIVRPPGHHCFDLPAGFCIANNVALAAKVALNRGARVAIIDWDYHFGDGTAESFLDSPHVMFTSLHCATDRRGMRTYPESKWKGDALIHRTRGRMFNIMWESDDADDAAYIYAFTKAILPALLRFKPDLILISAGYDALKGDNLAGMELTPPVFQTLIKQLKILNKPIVCVLEGGYNPELLGAGVRETLNGLLSNTNSLPSLPNPQAHHVNIVDEVIKNILKYI